MVPTGSHAYLTLALHWVEPREYVVPVIVSRNGQRWQLPVRGEARASVWPHIEGCRVRGWDHTHARRLPWTAYFCAHLHIFGWTHRLMFTQAHTQRSIAPFPTHEYIHVHEHTYTYIPASWAQFGALSNWRALPLHPSLPPDCPQ